MGENLLKTIWTQNQNYSIVGSVTWDNSYPKIFHKFNLLHQSKSSFMSNQRNLAKLKIIFLDANEIWSRQGIGNRFWLIFI